MVEVGDVVAALVLAPSTLMVNAVGVPVAPATVASATAAMPAVPKASATAERTIRRNPCC